MERQDLERIITVFQAKARGFLVRREFDGVRREYEDIVREIEGDGSYLDWRAGVIAIPLFTKNAFVWQSNRSPSAEKPGEPCSVSELTRPLGELQEQSLPEEKAVVSEDHGEAPSDSSPVVRGGGSSRPAEGDADQSKADLLEGGDPGRAEDARVWGHATKDAVYSCLPKGTPRRSQVKDIPRNEADLSLHRNNLSMELLWLQQAIDSRKKYLLLKQRLGSVER